MNLKRIALLCFAVLNVSTVAQAASVQTAQEPEVVFTAPKNWTEQRSALLLRRYQNEIISLRHVLGLYQGFQDYTVDSVAIVVRGGMVNSTLDLLVHGQVQQRVMMPQGQVILFPRTYQPLGLDMNSLQLGVSGLLDIESVTVNLRLSDRMVNQGMVTLPILVGRRMNGNGRIDLTPQVDMYRYNGYRIEAIEVYANAAGPVGPGTPSSSIEVLLDWMTVDYAQRLSPYPQLYIVRPMNAFIGRNVRNIGLQYRGSVEVREVRLRLIGP